MFVCVSETSSCPRWSGVSCGQVNVGPCRCRDECPEGVFVDSLLLGDEPGAGTIAPFIGFVGHLEVLAIAERESEIREKMRYGLNGRKTRRRRKCMRRREENASVGMQIEVIAISAAQCAVYGGSVEDGHEVSGRRRCSRGEKGCRGKRGGKQKERKEE